MMDHDTETLDHPRSARTVVAGGPPRPGLLLVHCAGQPVLAAIVLGPDREIDLGRGHPGDAMIDDPAVSRVHARARFADGRWTVRDLGSRNGTMLDGHRVVGERTFARPHVLRIGNSLFLPMEDVRPFVGAAIEVNEGVVMGPTLGRAMAMVVRAARAGKVLHVTGESGVGKEVAARAFHRLGPCPDGPFVPVNCAAIPEGVAERLLFGARRGAYSGASADAMGYLQSADGGTLLLDEVAELGAAVQAKILRVIETQEVLPLGASHPQAVRFRLCSATHRAMREQVASGRFREDLYYRIGRPAVALPPLRERPEEIPWLIDRELRAAHPARTAHVSLVEECLLRAWPGNVRELLTEVRAATLESPNELVEGRHLLTTAGLDIGPRPSDDHAAHDSSRDAEIAAVLRRERGNVSRAAAELGLHRTQLRRWIVRHRFGQG
jgi:DNA-binding NtrC family response regulator